MTKARASSLHDYWPDRSALPQKEWCSNLRAENIASLSAANGPNLSRASIRPPARRQGLCPVPCWRYRLAGQHHRAARPFLFLLRETGPRLPDLRDVPPRLEHYLHQSIFARPICAPPILALGHPPPPTTPPQTKPTQKETHPPKKRPRIESYIGHLPQYVPPLSVLPDYCSCYPLTSLLPPAETVRQARGRARRATCGLCYLGRLSEDKNFPPISSMLIGLNATQPSFPLLLIACATCIPKAARPLIVRRASPSARSGRFLRISSHMQQRRDRDIIARFDRLFLPSTS